MGHKLSNKMTPMMQQFYEIKKQRQDCILFFRMGDFYEMFDEDALIASKILGIALTSRNKASENAVPMCGIPYHSYQSYLTKLLNAGKKVAICEQLENPEDAKGIVKRGIVRVITPGTIVEDEALSSNDNNFLMAVYLKNNNYFIAYADISTGDLFLQKTENLSDTISKWIPREIISDSELDIDNFSITVSPVRSHFQTIKEKVLKYFKVSTEKSIGIIEKEFIYPLYLILDYIKINLLDVSLKKPTVVSSENELYLDGIAVKTLELIENSDNLSSNNTLFSVLNNCSTAMGERMLKRYILSPLKNIEKIRYRHEVVGFFVNDSVLRNSLTEQLRSIYDIERIITRVTAKRSNARDLVHLKKSIENLPNIRNIMLDTVYPHIIEFANNIDILDDIHKLINNSIEDEPPVTIMEGNIIKTGFDKDVDELRNLKINSKKILLNIESEERKKTGINNLKVKFNKVFGYYIEVSRLHSDKVPDYYERKQTLVNAERFIIDELKDLEVKILTAEDKLNKIEYEIFSKIRDQVESVKDRIRCTANEIAHLDVLLSLSEAAVKHQYVQPEISEDSNMAIVDGRHPIVEVGLEEPFIPNDLFMDNDENRLHIITGPNMSGKSTYIRMIALISIMAHMGSFVPAKSAKIGIIDRVFTRIGASDNLSKGESTFMVEMVETANILNNATDKSLVILDEIGRGTSTFDGVSIAWAVAEYLLNNVKSKTLFATHYHELTDIPIINKSAKNFTIDVKEWNNEIIFLRKIIEGSTDRSYGIYVGKLAGLPEEVISRSEEILHQLEKNEFNSSGLPKIAKSSKKTEVVYQPMLLFDEHPAIEEIKDLDINQITPIEALNKLNELKKMVDDE